MFVLVKYSKNYLNLEKEVIKNNLTPITLFVCKFDNKENIIKQLNQIKQIKTQNDFKYTVIKIEIINHKSINQSLISNLKQDFDLTIGLGGLNKTNRFFLEKTNVDFLLDPQNSIEKPKIDFIHHLNSGINHILTKFSKQKNIDFIFSLNFTNHFNKFQIAKEIGRINQNLKFARKYQVKSNINFIIENKNQIKSIKEIQAISSLFDISTTQKLENIQILKEKIKNNEQKKSKKYISNQIKQV